jgi:hypothetical protein
MAADDGAAAPSASDEVRVVVVLGTFVPSGTAKAATRNGPASDWRSQNIGFVTITKTTARTSSLQHRRVAQPTSVSHMEVASNSQCQPHDGIVLQSEGMLCLSGL